MRKPTTSLPTPLPRTLYLKCQDDTNPPAGYVGDWPVAGEVYAGRVLPHVKTGEMHVHLDGFHAEKPWGAFGTWRFTEVADVWLN